MIYSKSKIQKPNNGRGYFHKYSTRVNTAKYKSSDPNGKRWTNDPPENRKTHPLSLLVITSAIL